MARRKRITPLVSKDEAKQRHDLIDAAIHRYQGPLDELEAAIGMYMLGRHMGWKVLYMIHTTRTIKKYEEILGITLADVCEPFGPDAESANAYKALQAAESFWKIVSGNEKLPLTREERRSVG